MAAVKVLLAAFLITETACLELPHTQRYRRDNWPRFLQASKQNSVTPCQNAGFSGCCDLTTTSCYIQPQNCYCDLSCHLYNDCCLDIADINCTPPGQSTCALLDSPVNGMITYTPFSNPKRPGTIAHYTCTEGHALVGNPIRVCQHDLTWGGSVPQCRRTCPVLAAPGNGSITYMPQNSSPRKPVRTVAISKCNEGYVLAFEMDEQRICENSTRWGGGHTATCVVRSCRIQFAETGGCCVGGGCQIGPHRDQCSCSADCFTSHIISCCPDIGCVPQTCTEAGLQRGCCSWEMKSPGCYVPGGRCHCDNECHAMGDCCPDVNETTCSTPTKQVLTGQSVRTNPYSQVQMTSRFRSRGGPNQKLADDHAVRELASELRSMSQAHAISNKQQRAQWERILSELQELQKAKMKRD